MLEESELGFHVLKYFEIAVDIFQLTLLLTASGFPLFSLCVSELSALAEK